MTMKSESRFIITGDGFDPDLFLEAVPLAPTKTWRKGDFRSKSLATFAHNGWCICIYDERNILDVSESLRLILDIIEPHADEIQQICKQLSLKMEISCLVFTGDGRTPIVHFDPHWLVRVAALGAHVDIDIM